MFGCWKLNFTTDHLWGHVCPDMMSWRRHPVTRRWHSPEMSKQMFIRTGSRGRRKFSSLADALLRDVSIWCRRESSWRPLRDHPCAKVIARTLHSAPTPVLAVKTPRTISSRYINPTSWPPLCDLKAGFHELRSLKTSSPPPATALTQYKGPT